MARPTSPLDAVRARVRRAQLTVGLGFLALVIGQPIALSLMWRMGPRVQAMNSELAATIAATLILNLWVIAVLPALCYVVARVIPLRPVPTAVGAALTGQFIHYSIAVLSAGFASLFEEPGHLIRNVGMGAAGVVVTLWAIKAALQQREAADAAAQQAAAAKKNEYDQFAREAERLAALRGDPPDSPPAPPPPDRPPSGST